MISSDKVADMKGQIFKQLRLANEEMENRFRLMTESEDYRIDMILEVLICLHTSLFLMSLQQLHQH